MMTCRFPRIPVTHLQGNMGLAERIAIALPAGAVVESGGAPGVDSSGDQAAKDRGLEVTVFLADWDRHGRKAGPPRNADIVARADCVAAFWGGRSRGTLNTVVQAARAGRSVEVFDAEGRPVPIEVALRAAEERGVVAAIDAVR